MVPHFCRVLARLPPLSDSLQHLPRKDHDQCPRRLCGYSQHWRENHHKPQICWWHRWTSWRIVNCQAWSATLTDTSWCLGWKLVPKNQDHDKWLWFHQGRHLGPWSETWDSAAVQIPQGVHQWPMIKTRNPCKNCTMTALSKLKTMWRSNAISVKYKIRLLYACETWMLMAELQGKIQALEMRCNCTILSITYLDHITNDQVCSKIQKHIGPHKELLTTV